MMALLLLVGTLAITQTTGQSPTEPAKLDRLFADERTHTTAAGARLNAESVVTGLKAIDSPLIKYLAR